MQRTRLAPRARRKRPAPAPVVVATEIYAVEGELLATMDAVASRRVLKRDIKELTRLILVGGERPEYGPTGIPNLDRLGTYRPLPADYEAQALVRNADGVPGAAQTYTRIGAAVRNAAATPGTAKFVPTATSNGTANGATNGTANGTVNGVGNRSGTDHFGTNGSPVRNGAAPPSPVPAPPAPVVQPPSTRPAVSAESTAALAEPIAPAPPPKAPPTPALTGPLPVSRVVDGKVVPADAPAAPPGTDEVDEDLACSALSALDAQTLFGTFAADAALGGGSPRY